MRRHGRMITLGLAMASVVAGVGAVHYSAHAAEWVDPTDPVMNCQGPLAPGGYNCKVTSFKVRSAADELLPGERVTIVVAGCNPNATGSTQRAITWEKSTSIAVGGGAGLNGPLMGFLGDIGASASAQVENSVTYGESQEYGVAATYGYKNWGVFKQRVIVSKVDMEVTVTEPGDVPVTDVYSANGVTITAVVKKGALPDGELIPGGEKFQNVADFNKSCSGVPGSVLPDYLGGPGKTN